MVSGMKRLAASEIKRTMKYIRGVGLLLTLCGVSTALFGQSAEWNLDFEEWDLSDTTPALWHDTTVIENRVGLFPPKWHYRPDHIPERTGLGRTTDVTEGNYAVTLSGYYSYQVMRIISGESAVKSGWPIDFKPNKLTGDYKAILLGSCDSLRTYVDVYLTTYNGLNNNRDTIGQANIVLNEVSSYEQFELEIDYSNELLTPDTVIIVLAKERFGFDAPPACLECSHVFFDNLTLINTVSIQDPAPLNNAVEIFPNPVSQTLIIKPECEDCLLNITLISSSGQIVKRYNSVSYKIEINVNDLGKGFYFVKIEEEVSGNFMYKKVMIE